MSGAQNAAPGTPFYLFKKKKMQMHRPVHFPRRAKRVSSLVLGIGALLSALPVSAETIVIRSGQVGQSPGLPCQLDDTVRVIQVAGQSPAGLGSLDLYSPVYFTTQAEVVLRNGAWLQSLTSDPDARWINHRANPANYCAGQEPRSVLYGVEFYVDSCIAATQAATIDLCWAADDLLGDPSSGPNAGPHAVGVFLNGVPLDPSFGGGGIGVETCASQILPAGLLHSGPNTLHFYTRDTNAAVSGLLFSGTIEIDDTCPTQLGGTLYNDLNGNGSADPGEQGLAGWQIELTDSQGNVSYMTTDAQGQYLVNVGPCDSYQVRPVMEACWSRTTLEMDVYVPPCTYTALDFGVSITPGGPVAIDQSMEDTHGSHNIGSFMPVAQEIIATGASIAGIEIHVEPSGLTPLQPITLDVHAGGLAGTVVATATVLPSFTLGSQWVYFPVSFTTTAGQLFVIEVSESVGTWMWHNSSSAGSNPAYPGGVGYLWGAPEPQFDWSFRLWSSSDCSLGTPFCFGDGSGGACPCANFSSASEGCANSTGVGGLLGASGSSSVSLDNLQLNASQMAPNKPAFLMFNSSLINGGAGVPLAEGLLCLSFGYQIVNPQVTDSLGATSWGPGLAATHAWLAGQTVYFQVAYRDPGVCGRRFNFTNALEVVFTP